MGTTLVEQAAAALSAGQFATARDLIVRATSAGCTGPRAPLIRGLAELALGDWGAAQATLARAVQMFADQPRLWLNLGYAQENLGCDTAAIDSYQRCLALAPNQAEACGNLAHLLATRGHAVTAEGFARRALAGGAPPAQALNALGLALLRQGRFAAADDAFVEARRYDPTNSDICANWANAAVDRLDFEAAWPRFRQARALADTPTLRRDEGMARLLAGDYPRGWALWEARLDLPHALRVVPTCPRYGGQALAGKRLLVIAEQGFGDTLHFCRFAEILHASGATIILVVQKALVRLLSATLPFEVRSEEAALPAADYHVPLLSLPLVTGAIVPADWPAPPRLSVPSRPRLESRRDAARPGSPLPKFGLVWAGSPTHRRDVERSIALSTFEPLWNQVPAFYYAPFLSPALDAIGNAPIRRLDTLIGDFADTAALLRPLDALISVDTAVAHLAGTLGVPTLLLLPFCPDWRWGTGSDTTPWYPSITLLRQPLGANWASLIPTIIATLSKRHAAACSDA